MAKPSPTTDKNDQLALTKPGTTAAALALPSAAGDLLAGAGVDDLALPETGFGEYDSADLRIPALVFNAKGLDANENEVALSDFLHTVTRTTKKNLHLAIIGVHKSKAWTSFDGEKTVVHCEAWDGVTGTMEDGSSRPCKGCPDAQWRMEMTPNGKKRTRRCADADNVAVFDREAGELDMMRFRKTSLRPWRDYLQKYFIGKRPIPGKPPVDYPGFIFETIVRLELIKGGKTTYASPVFDVARDAQGRPIVLPRAEIEMYAQLAPAVREQLADMRESAKAADAEDNVHDASFDVDAFADESPPAGASVRGTAPASTGLSHE